MWSYHCIRGPLPYSPYRELLHPPPTPPPPHTHPAAAGDGLRGNDQSSNNGASHVAAAVEPEQVVVKALEDAYEADTAADSIDLEPDAAPTQPHYFSNTAAPPPTPAPRYLTNTAPEAPPSVAPQAPPAAALQPPPRQAPRTSRPPGGAGGPAAAGSPLPPPRNTAVDLQEILRSLTGAPFVSPAFSALLNIDHTGGGQPHRAGGGRGGGGFWEALDMGMSLKGWGGVRGRGLRVWGFEGLRFWEDLDMDRSLKGGGGGRGLNLKGLGFRGLQGFGGLGD